VGGVISKLTAAVSAAPVSPRTWVFTVIIGGNPTGITCTIPSGGNQCTDAVNTAPIAPGQTLSVRAAGTGNPGATKAAFSVLHSPAP
jgi:hypothetical protein